MASSIADLFFQGWLEVERWPGDAGRLDLPSDPEIVRAVRAYLQQDDEHAVLERLRRLALLAPADDTERAQLLLVLRAIDSAFEVIHPRSMILKPSLGTIPVPAWLARLEEKRRETGTYWSAENYALIPRGPLSRAPREDGCDGGRNIAERFSSLAVVLEQYRRPTPAFNLAYCVLSTDPDQGVRLGSRVGYERFVHLPLGQAPSDITLSLLEESNVTKLVSTVDEKLDVAHRFLLGASALGAMDVLMAPEFMVNCDAADAIANHLAALRNVDARIVAAGSGLSSDSRGGQHWNEARILNGAGHCLWRQRKIWPAVMKDDLTYKLGAGTANANAYEEATAAGNALVVADIDGFGRVFVLICQDLKLPTASAFISELQPDWILVPIFDRGVCEHRWTHVEACGLTGKSEARFVVGSSMSLARRLDPNTNSTCLMALGPRDPQSNDELPRAFFLSPVAHLDSGVEYAELTWRKGKWSQSNLGVVAKGEESDCRTKTRPEGDDPINNLDSAPNSFDHSIE